MAETDESAHLVSEPILEKIARIIDPDAFVRAGFQCEREEAKDKARAAIQAYESGLSGGTQAEANAGAANPESTLSGGSVEEARGESDELGLMLGWALDWIADCCEKPLEDEEPGPYEKWDRAHRAVAAWRDSRASSSPGASKGTREEVTVAREDLKLAIGWGDSIQRRVGRNYSVGLWAHEKEAQDRLRSSLTEGGESDGV